MYASSFLIPRLLYGSPDHLWGDKFASDEISGFIICKPILIIDSVFPWFCQKKLPDFNTSATRHPAVGMPKKSFVLPIFMPFYAQSYAFIGSKHSDYTVKALLLAGERAAITA